MASGLCAALTGRTHGCTDQPANVKKSLANSEPSTHGTSQPWQLPRRMVGHGSKADAGAQHGLEHGLQLAGRAGDDLQNLGRRRLLLPRFSQLARARFEFFLQLCSEFANAVNVSSRLRSRRTKTGSVRSALCLFARQGHLV